MHYYIFQIRKIVTEKKPRHISQTALAYRRVEAEGDETYCPFQKSILSKAAVKVGGEGNNTNYFLQDDGRTTKQKCVTIPFSVFTLTIQEKLVQDRNLHI